MPTQEEKKAAWLLDQLTKSEFFHLKLHEWEMDKIKDTIENTRGETLDWNLSELKISEKAWKKVIHTGIKPIVVFAHPYILSNIRHAVSYYRMLAMVSQKSMGQIGISTVRYEETNSLPDSTGALLIARRLNELISHQLETDAEVDIHEFDLWRGMAAGSQAQGAWINTKGERIAIIIQKIVLRRFREKGLLLEEAGDERQFDLTDGRKVKFSDEPDIALYRKDSIQAAIEIKGGIDKAGVLERIGAAIKSLHRAKEENPGSTTILILQGVSVTHQAVQDLQDNRQSVNYWFSVEDLIGNEESRDEFFKLLWI